MILQATRAWAAEENRKACHACMQCRIISHCGMLVSLAVQQTRPHLHQSAPLVHARPLVLLLTRAPTPTLTSQAAEEREKKAAARVQEIATEVFYPIALPLSLPS